MNFGTNHTRIGGRRHAWIAWPFFGRGTKNQCLIGVLFHTRSLQGPRTLNLSARLYFHRGIIRQIPEVDVGRNKAGLTAFDFLLCFCCARGRLSWVDLITASLSRRSVSGAAGCGPCTQIMSLPRKKTHLLFLLTPESILSWGRWNKHSSEFDFFSFLVMIWFQDVFLWMTFISELGHTLANCPWTRQWL